MFDLSEDKQQPECLLRGTAMVYALGIVVDVTTEQKPQTPM